MGKAETSSTMFQRRNSATANGFVQQRNARPRRRNAVANIFSELTESDIRALREQARNLLHPLAKESSTSASASSSSSDEEELNFADANAAANLPVGQRRRRNALHDIAIGVDRSELQQLRESALARLHPAAMMTTPPGAVCTRADAIWAGAASGPAAATASGSISPSTGSGAAALWDAAIPDQLGLCPHLLLPRPSQSFIVDSVTSVQLLAQLPRSRSCRYPWELTDAAADHPQPQPAAEDTITTITETDGDIFRERIARSSTR